MEFKSQLKKVDKYLMKFFPNEIYEILSYKSKLKHE